MSSRQWAYTLHQISTLIGLRRKRRFLLTTTLVYSLILFVTCLLVFSGGNGWFAAAVAIAVIGATMQLCAVWSALGPGDYSRRAFASLVAGAAVAMSGIAGVRLSQFGDDIPTQLMVTAGTILGPTIWLLCQIPLLTLRLWFGWCLSTERDNWHSTRGLEEISIRDILAFTTMAALAIGTLQVSRWTNYSELQPPALYTNIGINTAVLWVVQLFIGLPALFWISGRYGTESGCGAFTLYVLALVSCLGIVILTLSPLASVGAIIYFVIVIAYTFFFAFPLLVSRDAGYSLSTARSRRAMASASESTVPIEDASPFDD